jgi:haloalkane dehalogenase
MLENRLLLTTPTFPYPTLPWNDSLTDATGQRFTKGDDIFSIVSHTHCFANHILAQNVTVPSTLLEYPRWDDFVAEVDRGYPVLGISAFPVHLDTVMKMCSYVRQRSPATKILLGSYGGQAFQAQYDAATQKQYVDHVIHGEGVRFLRKFLGEENNRPIRQTLMPKAGGTLPFLSKYPRGTVGFLVSGLGCPGGCDFCSTTALFDRKRIELLTPHDLVESMHQYFTHFPLVRHIFVVEEDHFRYPDYLAETRQYWMGHPDMMERVDWFAFGSIDHIGQFAARYGWDALVETGIGAIFIGVESKFAGEHGYDKRDEIDARECFERLHALGIRTVGAWICGWDWHDHTNMHEDLNHFVSLYPTYQQLTRLSPFPGTVLWEKLKEEGRVTEVPWEDVHFWSGAQVNKALEPHETLNLTDHGYDLLYRTWGPSILRRLDVQLNGYDHCVRSDSPILRRHKSLFYKRQCGLFWTFLYAMDRFAPNGIVRRRVRKMDEKYRRLIGEPTPVMKVMGRAIEGLATAFKLNQFLDPMNRHPKEEPFKRYIYDKNGDGTASTVNGGMPYRTEHPGGIPLWTRLEMQREGAAYAAMETAMRAARIAGGRNADPDTDRFLIDLFHSRGFGFGF